MLTVLVAVVSCAAQTDEPVTVEKCRADYKQWTAPSVTPSRKELSVEALNTRSKEMLYCEMTFRAATDRPEWLGLENQLNSDIQLRYMHFLERHHLWNTFLDEDEKGER